MDQPDTELRFLPGIGPSKAAALAGQGLKTLRDLLIQVPRLIGAAPPRSESGPLPAGSEVRVRARLVATRPVFARGRRGGLDSTWERADGRRIQARFFQAGYLRRHLLPGEWYLLEGRSDASAGDRLLHPSFVHLAQGADTPIREEAHLRVAYRIPDGIGERRYAELVEHALAISDQVGDPGAELSSAEFGQHLRNLHRPTAAQDHEAARRVLAAREVTALAWRLRERRQGIIAAAGWAWRWDEATDARARARLPFALTAGQEAALREIRRDLQAPTPMYRLLNGDVGSGKTALALISALAVIADGGQVMLLAPTAILAHQHHAFITTCLKDSRVRCAVLTAASDARERQAASDSLADGICHLVIGTHVLFDERFRPRRCGLIIIDEQHRFGVGQRSLLASRRGPDQDWQADLLLMTATAIPRTLALTAYGDLAVSRIAGRPPGRSAPSTRIESWPGVSGLIAGIGPADGGRTFIICPLRQDGDDQRIDAESLYRTVHSVMPTRTALIHGGLDEESKHRAITAFASGECDVLVATSVIEVGIDVPAADRLWVVDADRFGLASLHQMRGRIGRGERPATCVLYHRQGATPERLRILGQHSDGLAIAEADLEARGSGELLGTAQHGLPSFLAADLGRDLDLLLAAHQRVATELDQGRTMPPGLAALLPPLDGLASG